MNFTPLNDMILVKPDLMDDKIGSIYIPQGALKAGDQPGDYLDAFVGTIAATGPGDPRLTLRCHDCFTERVHIVVEKFGRNRTAYREPAACECGCKKYDVVCQDRAPMEVKVGDRVVFPRRPNSPGGEFSVALEGEKYILMHEQQSAFAVLEEGL